MRLLVEFWRAEEGTTLIEYALIGSALSIMIIAGVRHRLPPAISLRANNR